MTPQGSSKRGDRGRFDRDRGGGRGRMDTQAEDGLMWPQAQEGRLPPAVGRDQEGPSPGSAACRHPDFIPGMLT